MGTIFTRGRKLYAKTKAVDGSWKQIATGLNVGDDEEAERWLEQLERRVAAEREAVGSASAPLTVKRYADEWLKKRKTKTVRDDRTRLERHALPLIGGLLLGDVRPRHVRDVIMALRNAGELAPATIRQVSGILHTMFKSAVIEELVASNPVVLERGTLPKKVDKDPNWRHQAIYTRAEVEALISDDRILADRRILYALKALAALRHGEAAALTWAQYDAVASPLGALNLGQTKSGVPRRVPVHATLAKILAAWKLSGWEATFGRAPRPEDLIAPTRRLAIRDPNESQRQLIADLELLKFRTKAGARQNRRGHDLRRTFITLARTDGAQKDILRWVTHGPSATEMMDVYSSFDWGTLCAEVAKLKLDLLEGKLIALPIRAVAGGGGSDQPTGSTIRGADVVQSPERSGTAAEKKRPRRGEM